MTRITSPADHTVTHNGVVRTIVAYLAVHRAWQMKLLGGLGQRPGVPDLLAMLGGRAIAIEVKTGTAKLSPRQEVERDTIIAAGGIYILASTVEDVEDRLVAEGLVRPAIQRRRTS